MKNKNRVREGHKDYQEFTDARGGYDPASLEHLWETASPFDITPMDDKLDATYDKLTELFYSGKLHGRQREILALLLDGVLNQYEIARRLNITDEAVACYLRRLAKKVVSGA